MAAIPKEAQKEKTDTEAKDKSDYYTDSYGHPGIHQEMLQDRIRTNAYRRAILDNKELFKDKIVLDVGCGTGILSMFAADAGAKHVYAIDAADVADIAKLIIKENNFEDTITVIKAKMEEVELPVEKVDIIISEWMGYCLLYESMLDCVLYARDKFLTKDGIVMPDSARLHICAIEDEKYKFNKFEFWSDVYGYKMDSMREHALKEPLIDFCPPEQSISNSFCFYELDLYKCTVEDLDFTANFELIFTREETCHALVVYFDCIFGKCNSVVGFTTAPAGTDTHWKQTVFYLKDPIEVQMNDVLRGTINLRKNKKNPRALTIDLSVSSPQGKQSTRYYIL